MLLDGRAERLLGGCTVVVAGRDQDLEHDRLGTAAVLAVRDHRCPDRDAQDQEREIHLSTGHGRAQ